MTAVSTGPRTAGTRTIVLGRVLARDRWLAIGFGVLATVISAWGSWIPSLWGDEATTSVSARRSFASLVMMAQHVDAVHSTYYALMHLWVDVAGYSAVALRFPSAVAVGVAVAGVCTLIRWSGGSSAFAAVAAVLTAVIPRMTYAGEEARSFAMTAAVATWIIAIVVGTLSGRVRRRLGWWIVAVLMVVGTYLFMYTLLTELAVVALVASAPNRSKHWRLWLVTTILTALAVLPVVAAGWLERAQISYLSHRVTTDPYSLFVGVWFSDTQVAVISWCCIALAVIAAVGRPVLQRHGMPQFGSFAAAWARTNGLSGRFDLAIAVWAFAPPALLVAAQVVFHGFSSRYMTFTAPAAAILVARGLQVLWSAAGEPRLLRLCGQVIAGVALAALLVTTWFVWADQRTPYAKNGSDWAEVSAVVGAHARPGQDVLFDETASDSRRTRLAMRAYPAGFRGLHDVALTTPYWKNTTWHDRALTITKAVAAGRVTSATVWVVQWDGDHSHGTEGDGALRAAGYRPVRTWHLHTDTVIEYRR